MIIDIILKRKAYDTNIEFLFESKFIDSNYKNGLLITLSAFYGNTEMLKILKKYGADFTIRGYEPLLLASQNADMECIDILFTDDIDIENFKYTSSYKNLCKFKADHNSAINSNNKSDAYFRRNIL